MNLREHLQLLAMMIPTLLLLAAAAFSLAFPSQGAGAQSVRLVLALEASRTEATVAHNIDLSGL